MKKTSVFSLVAFLLAISAVFAFSPPPGSAYGKHTSLGCVLGTLESESCGQTTGIECSVTVGSGASQQIKPAYFSSSGCNLDDSNDRVRKPN